MPSITFGRWNPTEVMERRLDGDWPNPTPFATNLVIPTSVTVTGSGSSATISTNGSITFSSVDQMYVNGVFSSDFQNYMIVLRMVSTADNDNLAMRMSNGGAATTDTNYTQQYLQANGGTVASGRVATQSAFRIANPDDSQRSGTTVYLYGPALAQPTALRDCAITGFSDALLLDFCGTHSTATSYDGFWLDNLSGLITGRIAVYGLGV